jgi:fatty acid desaturase
LNARWLAALFTDYSVVALAMVCSHSAFIVAQQNHFDPIWSIIAFIVIVLAVIVIGTRQHAILILAHDGSHGHASRSRWRNDFLTNLFSLWPFGMGLSGYRKFHFAHHRYMGTASDPELVHKKRATPAYDLPSSPRRIIRLAITALFAEGSSDQMYFIKYIILRNSLRDKIAPIALWVTIVLVFWHFNAWWIAILWFIALGTSFNAVFRLRVWTEHVGTAGVHRISAGLFYRMIFLPHNSWCHFEHHHFPTVPFWNLPNARAREIETPVCTLESLFASYRNYGLIPSGSMPCAVKQPKALDQPPLGEGYAAARPPTAAKEKIGLGAAIAMAEKDGGRAP